MKIVIDYKPIYLSNNIEPIVKWKKTGPIVFSNYKLRNYFNYDINKLKEYGDEQGLLELLEDIKDYHYQNKCYQIQIDEVIDYVKNG
jgi:hypothetical protein